MADDVLHSGVRGVTDLMVMPGLINLDFADIRAVMSEMGKAMMGTGEAEGDRRAIDAAEAAISNPLLEDVSMKGARGVLINITGGPDMTLFEVDEAANRIREEVDPEANIIFGSTFDEKLDRQDAHLGRRHRHRRRGAGAAAAGDQLVSAATVAAAARCRRRRLHPAGSCRRMRPLAADGRGRPRPSARAGAAGGDAIETAAVQAAAPSSRRARSNAGAGRCGHAPPSPPTLRRRGDGERRARPQKPKGRGARA